MKLFCFLIRQSNRYIKCVVKLEAPKNPMATFFKGLYIQVGLYSRELNFREAVQWIKHVVEYSVCEWGDFFSLGKSRCFKKLTNATWVFFSRYITHVIRISKLSLSPPPSLFTNYMLPNYKLVMLSLGRRAQKRIQNPVKHLRWSVLQKPLIIFAKSSILGVWKAFEYASGVAVRGCESLRVPLRFVLFL